MKSATALAAFSFVSALAPVAWAQQAIVDMAEAHAASEAHADKSADEIARELANPNNSLASLTFKNQYRFYEGSLPGADSQDNFTTVFQPVFPFTMNPTASGGKANLFVRPGIPLLFDQPVFDPTTGTFGKETGLGDIGFDIGYGVTEPNGFLWAYGMVGTLPTATSSEIGGGQWRLGPEALFAKFEKWGLYGIFPSHQWDVAGWEDRSFSNSQIQMFFVVLPGGGWSVGSTPILNYDWPSDQWTIPLNLTVSKTVKIGNTPWKLAAEINYYVEKSDAFGPEWMIGINITPVVNNFVEGWIRGK